MFMKQTVFIKREDSGSSYIVSLTSVEYVHSSLFISIYSNDKHSLRHGEFLPLSLKTTDKWKGWNERKDYSLQCQV